MSMSFSSHSFIEFDSYDFDKSLDLDFVNNFFKNSMNGKIKSNGSIKYYYKNDILTDGFLNFSQDFKGYQVIFSFRESKFTKISINSTPLHMYDNTFSLDLSCNEIFDHIQDCDTNNIYTKKFFLGKNPELRQTDQVDIQMILEKNYPTEDGERDFNKMVVEVFKIHLKANHFSAQFIDNFSKAAYRKLAIQ